MPRHADHEERKAELADAVSRIILEHGVERVSVRSVAQASGWSVGAVRYYFPRQEDLLSYAFRQMIERAVARIGIAEQADMSDPVEWAYQLLWKTAPVNDATRRDIRIWLAFVDRGFAREHVAELMDEVWMGGRFYSRRMVAAMAGVPLPDDLNETLADPILEDAAAILHLLWNGISFQGIMAPDRLDAEEIGRLTRHVVSTICDRVQVYLASRQAMT
jgi:AcrR family transcriptional regulator